MFYMNFSAVRPIAAALAISFISAPVCADDADTTRAVLEHHLAAFAAGDMDAFLSDYTDSSVVMVPGLKATGPAELQPTVQALFDEFSQEGVTMEMIDLQVDGRLAFVAWSAETPNNSYEFATDTFLIEGGKIVYQTFAGKITPK